MRTLVVGAGATGGYYGARLSEAGADITFLVRPARAARLASEGLKVASPLGDLHLREPRTITAAGLPQAGAFDLVLLSCKAYDLDAAIADVAPAVGEGTAILPVLNGMAHLDALDTRLRRREGPRRKLRHRGDADAGGHDPAHERAVQHHLRRARRRHDRPHRLVDALMKSAAPKFQPRLSDRIELEMWEKWVFLATLASGTTLMRAAIGDIVAAPGGTAFLTSLHEECTAIAAASGFAPREKVASGARGQLTAAGSTFTASMLRDIEGKGRIEADHVIGDLIARGQAQGIATPMLDLAYTGLKAYEARRARETKAQ